MTRSQEKLFRVRRQITAIRAATICKTDNLDHAQMLVDAAPAGQRWIEKRDAAGKWVRA